MPEMKKTMGVTGILVLEISCMVYDESVNALCAQKRYT